VQAVAVCLGAELDLACLQVSPASELPGYTMDGSMRIRINDFLTRNESPVTT